MLIDVPTVFDLNSYSKPVKLNCCKPVNLGGYIDQPTYNLYQVLLEEHYYYYYS